MPRGNRGRLSTIRRARDSLSAAAFRVDAIRTEDPRLAEALEHIAKAGAIANELSNEWRERPSDAPGVGQCLAAAYLTQHGKDEQ